MDDGTGFLRLEGDGIVVRNLTVRHFYEGIHSAGVGNTVERMLFSDMCDDALTNRDEGVGTLFRNVEVDNGCDKCIQHAGNVSLITETDPASNDYYNAVMEDVILVDCKKPIRLAAGGRFMIRGLDVKEGQSSYDCDTVEFTVSASDALVNPLYVYLEDSSIEGCAAGLKIGGSAEAVLLRNTIIGNDRRGVLLKRNVRVSLAANIITGNGGTTSSELGFGGVAVSTSDSGDDPRVDLGGGSLAIDGRTISSPGYNTLCSNTDAAGNLRDIDNRGPNEIKAELNWWCDTDPSDQVSENPGTVDYLPALDADPN